MKIWRLAMNLVESLYQDCAFRPNAAYGDDAVKKGLLMNLYGAANDVKGMLFFHRYRTAVYGNDFRCFEVSFDENSENALRSEESDEFLNRDFFKDKRLYSAMMATLENTSMIRMGTTVMLSEAEEIFGRVNNKFRSGVSGDMESRVLFNILCACETADYTETDLYYHTRKALKAKTGNR